MRFLKDGEQVPGSPGTGGVSPMCTSFHIGFALGRRFRLKAGSDSPAF